MSENLVAMRNPEKKRKRKRVRKARTLDTDIPSSSSDDSDSDKGFSKSQSKRNSKSQHPANGIRKPISSPPALRSNGAALDTQPLAISSLPVAGTADVPSPPTSSPASPPPPTADAPQVPVPAPTVAPTPPSPFEAFYLRTLTAEFANDLDALRRAPDFRGEASVKVLIKAMSQGVELFSERERAVVMSGNAGRVRP